MRYTASYIVDLETVVKVPRVNDLRHSTLYITGATGLIGSCLSDMLLNLNKKHGFGMRVYLAGRDAERIANRFSFWNGCYEYISYNTSDEVYLPEDVDYVFHCACKAHPIAYSRQPVETALGIIQGTAKMLEAIARRGFGKLLFVSSSEVYGKRFDVDLYKEDDYAFVDPLSARSCYPNAKRMAETLCSSYHDEYGVDFMVARPGHVYGPTAAAHDTRAHAQFALAAAGGRDIVMKSDGSQLRSYCYCVDCATALLSILLNGTSGEAYNVAYASSNVTVRQLAESFAKAGGVDIVLETPSDAEAKGYNPMSCSVLDSAKIENLGWRGQFDVTAGTQRTIDCLRT